MAKLILNARERFRVNFKSSVKDKNLYFCRKDGSVWLSRDEALTQFKRSAWKKDFYEEVVSECEPPKGSFSAVAKCSISGELLGPPNYHGYQERLHALHAERFSNMPIDRYRSKIIIEKGEEVVAEWLKSMSQKTSYRPYGEDKNFSQLEQEAAKNKESEKVDQADEGKSAVAVSEDSVAAEEVKTVEQDTASEPFAEVEQESVEAAKPQDEENLLESLNEVERHFIEKHFDQVFSAQEHAYVPGDIAGKLLSPGLLTLLKVTVSEERRYPGKLAAFMCRQLSGRHLAIFKWKGKLKAGPARPHAVPEDVVIADRPLQILNWLRQNSGKGIDKLWDTVLEKDASDEDKKAWYSDLHWLINQGYVLFMHDGILHLSKPTTQKQAKAEEAKPEAKTEEVIKSPETKPEEGA